MMICKRLKYGVRSGPTLLALLRARAVQVALQPGDHAGLRSDPPRWPVTNGRCPIMSNRKEDWVGPERTPYFNRLRNTGGGPDLSAASTAAVVERLDRAIQMRDALDKGQGPAPIRYKCVLL